MEALEKRILQGDQEAFKEWMEIHIQAIERLAVQYGLTPQDAGKVAETVFGNLYRDLGHLTEERLEENALFKSALQEVKEFQVDTSETALFPFEEDNELHEKLIKLPGEKRIVFILSHFHAKSTDEIAWIVEKPVEQVADFLYQSKNSLVGVDIEKQLEFLNLSYQRLRSTYNETNIFHSTPREKQPSDEPVTKTNPRKKPILLWLAGSVMLVLILSITVIRSDAYQQSSAEKFIENKKIAFQKELEDRYRLIGLPMPDEAETNQDYIYGYSIDFGNETSRQFTLFMRELERQVESEGKINKKEATEKYDELVRELWLPSEMLDQLRKEPIKDREQSMVFLSEFATKNEFLASAYMGVFGKYSELIFESELYSDGVVDIEALMKKKPEFPIELQNAMDGLETQYYSLVAIKDYVPLSLKYENPEVRETLQQNLHLDAEPYIFLIMGGLDVLQFGTYADQMDVLLELDKQLPKTRYSDPLIDRFDFGYSWLIFFMSGLSNGEDVYDWNRGVKEEVKEKWRHLASLGDSSPAGAVMQEIVDEMEAADWTVSFENDIHSQFFERVKDKINELRERK